MPGGLLHRQEADTLSVCRTETFQKAVYLNLSRNKQTRIRLILYIKGRITQDRNEGGGRKGKEGGWWVGKRGKCETLKAKTSTLSMPLEISKRMRSMTQYSICCYEKCTPLSNITHQWCATCIASSVIIATPRHSYVTGAV